jgi:hypothetical protein
MPSPARLTCLTLACCVWAGASEVRASAATERVPVTLSTQLANNGWSVVVHLADEDVREIFYRLDEQGDFRSLGLSPVVNPKNGLPVPVTFFNLPKAAGAQDQHRIAVKWLTANGTPRGPYDLTLSLAQDMVKNAKYILETITSNSWVAFADGYKGKRVVYFTHLLSFRNALREIRYSLDDASVSKKFAFTPWTKLGETPTVGDDPIYVEVPAATKSIAVQLLYLDGTASEIKTFSAATGE